ncbi:hypothetical protein ACLB1N_36690 [Escherichia coli]
MHLGFEAAGRLDDAQRHSIMQKRSEPDCPPSEQARTVGHKRQGMAGRSG